MIVAEAEPSADLEASADAEPAPMESAESKPPFDLEPHAAAEPDRPIVSAWGFRVEPELTVDPAFLDREMSADPEPDVKPELKADEEPNPITSLEPEFSVEPGPRRRTISSAG